MSASGYRWARTDQVPWSRPQVSRSVPIQTGLAASATASASSGEPGAAYSNANSSSGKPKKSWMVRGSAMAVTADAWTNQCADTARMARGRGSVAASTAQASVHRFRSRVFIGLPCPMNTAGITSPTCTSRSCQTEHPTSCHAEGTDDPRGASVRPQPLIGAADVAPASRWYQHALGLTSDHGGTNYERLLAHGELVLPLPDREVHHHHGAIGDPAVPFGNGVLLWF